MKINNGHIGLFIIIIVELSIIGMLLHDERGADTVQATVIVDTTERDSLMGVIDDYEDSLQWWRTRIPIIEFKYIILSNAIDTISADSATVYFSQRTGKRSILLNDSTVCSDISAIRAADKLFLERDMYAEKYLVSNNINNIQDRIISAYSSRDSLLVRENDMYRLLADKYYLWYGQQEAIASKRGEIIKWGAPAAGLLFILALIF